MTDEIFISEKTGQRYKVIDNYIRYTNSNKLNVILDPIIEPKLEVGDWLLWAVPESPKPDDRILSRITYGGDFPINLYHANLLEIRKSNGQVWVKEREEWKVS